MARILVVDDEREVVMMLQFMLEKSGYEVAVAYDGAQALAALGVEPRAATTLPDIVVMDMRMPVMDGATACRRMAADARAKAIPVIVLTGDAAEWKRLSSSFPNVVAHLEKPFEPKRLRELIAQKLPPASPEVSRA